MEEIPVVTVIHKLPGRIRLHLSVEPKDHQQMISSVKDHEGFESMTYTPVTRSVLINFDPRRVKREEILIRVALYMSLDQESHCAHIFSQLAKQEMSDSVFYSGISLLIALLLKTSARSRHKGELDRMDCRRQYGNGRARTRLVGDQKGRQF